MLIATENLLKQKLQSVHTTYGFMPFFSPRKRKDKRKATEEPSDGKGNPGKRQDVSNGSTVMATALGADIPKPSLP